MPNRHNPLRLKAADIMATEVLTVPASMTLHGLALLFSENKISGAPVVDRDHNVVGVVSETDLVRHQATAGVEESDDWAFFRSMEAEDVEAMADGFRIEQLPDALVSDIMTTRLITASEDDLVSTLASQMLERRVHRLLIVKDRKLRGIVTTMDMLRVLTTARPDPFHER
ncbi:MAG: CBS domain-containing protein [Candidatus Wallbacteria bacterium]|nr:CBS domain-containing protein [Candidatus Wallbacteria bacterium]